MLDFLDESYKDDVVVVARVSASEAEASHYRKAILDTYDRLLKQRVGTRYTLNEAKFSEFLRRLGPQLDFMVFESIRKLFYKIIKEPSRVRNPTQKGFRFRRRFLIAFWRGIGIDAEAT